MGDFFLIVFLIGFLGSSAFLSGSETALFSLSPFTLRSYRTANEPRKQLIARLMNRPHEVLVTILMLNVLANLLIQNVVSGLFDRFSGWGLKIGIPLILTLIFGELLPKSISLLHNKSIAYYTTPVIAFLLRVLKPIRQKLSEWTLLISRTIFFFLEEEKASPAQLLYMLEFSQERGIISLSEAQLTKGVLSLKKVTVRELMRPRKEILYYDIRDPLSKLFTLLIDKGCSRLPICDGYLDQLLGILTIQSFFMHQETIQNGSDLIPFLQKPVFIPESVKGWALLQHLRKNEKRMGVVVDEYGGIAGLITQEDLIETIVGEIKDVRDVKSLYMRSGDSAIIASGKLELSQFESVFGVRLESRENIVTLGGWLIEQLGDIPVAGTQYKTKEFLFYILAADPNRIRRIYIRRLSRNKTGLL